MLQQLLYVLIITIFCLIWGIPVLFFFKKRLKESEKSFWLRTSTGLYCSLYFLGLITLSFVSSFLYLFFPLNFTTLIITTVILLFFLFFKKKDILLILRQYPLTIKSSLAEISFVSICIILFIILGTLPVVNADTKIYHIQIIKWANEYRIVPGLANLFPRYGLGSNWFNLISIFKIPFLNSYNYSWLNTTTVIWFLLWLTSNWRYHFLHASTTKPNKIFCHFYLVITIFCLLEWELFRDTANSSSYDFIVTALTLMLLLFFLEEIFFTSQEKGDIIIAIIICLSLPTFKLSGVFSFLIILYYLFYAKRNSYWKFIFIAGCIINIPVLIKNYIITGYPLFPLSISLFSPDWQVPAAMTDYLRQFIYVTNRNYNASIDYTHIPELMHVKWINTWFKGIQPFQKMVITGSFSTILIFLFNPKFSVKLRKIRFLFLIITLMAASWFFSAPSPRFGYGSLLVMAFFPTSLYLGSYLTTRIHIFFLYGATVFICFYITKKMAPIFNTPQHIVSPFPLQTPNSTKQNNNGVIINIPEEENSVWMRDCIDTQLPCACQSNEYLFPRGGSIKEGFKMQKQLDSNFVRHYVY